MSKKRSVGCPWNNPTQALPKNDQQVLVRIREDDDTYTVIAIFDASRGWEIPNGDTFLNGTWRVEFWMEIPEAPPF